MSSPMVWFGNREQMQWVPAWAAGPRYGREGSIETNSFLNGGFGGRFARDSHRIYDLAWNLTSAERLQRVTDYADGNFGDGLIYWSDPGWQRGNVLPKRWAAPWLATEDAPPLLRDARPELIRNPAPGLNYPTFGARYRKTATSVSDSIFIPVPPRHNAWVGVHGESNAAGVVGVRRYEGISPSGPVVKPAVLPTNTTTRVNTKIDDGEQMWIEVFFDLSALADGAAFDLYALMVQIIPVGVSPAAGRFVSGQGHSGCEWTKLPDDSVFSTALDLVSTSATLTEVGSWL